MLPCSNHSFSYTRHSVIMCLTATGVPQQVHIRGGGGDLCFSLKALTGDICVAYSKARNGRSMFSRRVFWDVKTVLLLLCTRVLYTCTGITRRLRTTTIATASVGFRESSSRRTTIYLWRS